jgi:hypothetical protein
LSDPQRNADKAESLLELEKVPEFDKHVTNGAQEVISSFDVGTKESTWDPADKHAAYVQAKIAFRLIWVLIGVLAGGGALLATTKWTGLPTKDVSSFFGVAFAAVVTLTTAATSFWFGSQKERSRKG